MSDSAGDVSITVALAGDTMLGRGVAEHLAHHPPGSLFAPELVEVARSADLFVLNLECCISERGDPWPAPGKPFYFRASPAAVEALALLGVDCVTCANNHALDFGPDALMDTLEHLDRAGIEHVGAGSGEDSARNPATLEARGFRLGVVGVTDHPADFAAGPDRAGVAFADLRTGVPGWLVNALRSLDADAVVATPHWGPNMAVDPVPHVRAAAPALLEAGATLVAGHSAHVFQGVGGSVLYDLGDFIDDYAVDPVLRNDLGLLWLVELDRDGPVRLEAVPLRLDYCHTRIAGGEDREWIVRRFREACAGFETEVSEAHGRLVVTWR
jgi:poly-gamma-glutamate capsule biosynthesis protein CapA/YwtB (metallophosphatase superfamily)